MTIEERIEMRIAELDALIAAHDRKADAARDHRDADALRAIARGYCQAKLELVRLRAGVTP